MARGDALNDVWELAGLEQRIGYRMTDRSLLRSALTHKSYSNEQPRAALPYGERQSGSGL